MKWRVWLLSLGITLFCVLMFGLASTQVYYKSSVDDGRKYLSVYMNEYAESEYPLDEAGAKAFSERLNGARVTFMDAQGNVLADSEAEKPETNHSNREEVIEALENGKNGDGFAVRSSATIGKNMMYYCRNFDGAYLVRISIVTDSDWLIFVKTLPTLASFFAVMLLLCVATAFAATNIVVTPVKKLAEEAAKNGLNLPSKPVSARTRVPSLLPVSVAAASLVASPEATDSALLEAEEPQPASRPAAIATAMASASTCLVFFMFV